MHNERSPAAAASNVFPFPNKRSLQRNPRLGALLRKTPFTAMLLVATVVTGASSAAEPTGDAGPSAVATSTVVGPVRLFVAPQGDDRFSGTLPQRNAEGTDGPLATLNAARDRLRALRKEGGLPRGATIELRGGVFSLPETLKLSKENSATAEGPIVVRAFEQEKPIVIGAKPISGWKNHRGPIWKTNVREQGFANIYFRQLFFDGRRQHLARYPNYDPENPYGGGWAYVDGEPVGIYQDIPGEKRDELTYREQDRREWSRPDELEVCIFPRYNWWNNIVGVKAIDRETRKITLKGNCSYPPRPLDRYYVRNAFEELDAPGEWYLDKQDGTLYFYPPRPLSTTPVYAPHLRTIIEANELAHWRFQGINFENCEGTALVFKNCEECTVERCTIRNVGDYHGTGVSATGGRRVRIVGCDISETGSHGIALSGGDRIKLVPAEHEAVNNYIHHVGVFYKHGVGVNMTGCGIRAAHNLIHDGPRMGIQFSGNNLLIELNHIRHVNLETEDTGAVYTGGRDWISSRGTVIRHNYFHDILGFGRHGRQWVSPYFAWGVYLDDNAGGVDVVGNIVVRAYRAGLHLHNGRDNLIENNIFVDGKQQQIEFSGWTDQHRYWANHMPTMLKGYESVINEPAWKNMRNIHIHPSQAVLPDRTIMSGNVVRRNIIYYRDPQTKLYTLKNVNLDRNRFEQNLVYCGGGSPQTGYLQLDRVVGPNLLLNADFAEGEPGKLPPKWNFQHRPAEATAVLDLVEPLGEEKPEKQAGATVAADRSARAVRLSVKELKDAQGKASAAAVVSQAVEAAPGQAFRITVKLRADQPETAVKVMAQSYQHKVYFWAKEKTVNVGPQWQTVELVFQLPAPGELGYHAQIKSVAARVDLTTPSRTLWISNPSLQAAKLLEPWRSWQTTGQDRGSLVADPLFVDPDRDDYRLRPESPAWKLGFQRIPVERIGPQPDLPRATWPIVEAEGVREKPMRTIKVH